jgi:Outer membrane protein beta-barrel domain
MRTRFHDALATAVLLVVLAAPARAFTMKAPAVILEGGVSSTDLFPDPYLETHRILSGTGGLALDLHFSDKFSLEPGVIFVRRGARLGDSQVTSFTGPGGTIKSFLTADYTQIPVMGRFEPPTESMFKPFALVGASFGFKTAEQLRTEGAIDATYPSSRFKSFELGFVAGGGVEYGLGHHRLVMDLRYDSGITEHDAGNGIKFHSDAVMLMAGYVYHPGS